MGGLGWLVLGQERESGQTADGSELGAQDGGNQQPQDKLKQAELLKIANDNASPERLDAIFKLIDVEQNLPTLVPALSKMLFDRSELVRIAAGIVLNKVGSQGAPHLRPMMESADAEQYAIACSALKEMGGANLYADQIKEWLLTDDSISRKRALFALQGSNEGVLELLDPIIGTLEDPDFNVQCMACRVLVKLGPDAIDATDELMKLYKTGLPSARGWAVIALGAIGPNKEFDTAEFLVSTLDAFIQQEKQRSLIGLAKMGPEAIKVAEQVREVMKDKQKRVMPHAAFALWRITGETEEPLKVLAEGLNDFDSRDATLELIGEMQDAAKPLVGDVVKLIKNLLADEQGSLELAVIALGNIGQAAKDSLPTLQKIAEDKELDAVIRFYAREAIEKISKKD
jgi:HEAT repeat protein